MYYKFLGMAFDYIFIWSLNFCMQGYIMCSSLISVSMIKHSDYKATKGRKRIYLAYTSTSQSVNKGSQAKTQTGS